MKKQKYISTILIILISFLMFSGCEDILMEENELNIDIEGKGEVNVKYEGETFTEEDTIVVLQDETVVLEPVADQGYSFEEWTGTNGNDVISENDEWKLVMDNDKEITAVFEQQEIDLTVEPATIDFEEESETADLTVTVDPDDANITYESANSDIASVDNNGTITAEGAGSTQITVSAEKEGYISAEQSVNVNVEPDLEVINITDEIILEDVDNSEQIDIETDPEDVQLTFSSDDESIATVDDNGLVTAVGPGETQITIKINKENYNEYSATVPVKVLDEFDLTIDIDGEGSVSPAAGTHTYTENTEVTLESTSEQGWTFKEWSGSDGGDVNYDEDTEEYIITMDADKNITAVFEDQSAAAKTFVNNIKDHGVNLQNIGKEQTTKIEENMTQELIPYSVSAGYRLGYFGEVLLAWRHMIYRDGEFTIDLDKFNSGAEREEWIIEKPDESYEPDPDKEIWEWTINLAGREEQVTIKSTSRDIVLNDEETDEGRIRNIDFSEAKFVYEHYFGVSEGDDPSSDDEWEPNWQFDFEMDSEHQDIYVDHDFVWNTFDELRITYPQDPVFDIKEATLEDELEIVDYKNILQGIFGTDDVPELPPIGTLTIDGILDLGHNDDQVYLDGQITSDVIDIDGTIEIIFTERPPLDHIVDGLAFPQPESITINENYETNVFQIQGKTDIDFITKDFVLEDGSSGSVSLPDLIEFDGLYQDLTEENGFSHDGLVTINPDYSEFSIDLSDGNIESADNYVAGYVEVIGEMLNTGFENVNLYLTLDRSDYKTAEVDFKYDFSQNKYIEGTADIDIANKEFKLDATNDQGLGISMTITPTDIENSLNNPDTPQSVGEITSDIDNGDIIGEIVLLDGLLSVQFLDGNVVPFLPETAEE